jgi:phosphoribosyl-ATP pyrophosphohydrolase/phosphoribosyl-AMP cyclohydrolase/histidinol dehydrogenase
LDPSIVDIEIVISSADVLQSDGCVAACFLDAGCHAIVLPDGTDGTALDACQLPRDRVVAHFNDTYTTNTESLLQLLLAAAPLASTMSLAFPVGTNMEDTLSTLNSGLSSSDKVALVVQVPAHTEGLEQVVGRMSKMGTTMCIVDPTAQELGMSYVACIRTDRPDGLYTTVVCTRSNEALGLVYSSKVTTSFDTCAELKFSTS